MRIEKDPLPTGYSFVLRSQQLESALASAGITVDTALRHINSSSHFTAHYWLPNPNVAHERFYVTAGVVPAGKARDIREFMETKVLPQFITWAKGVLALPVNSTMRERQQFTVDLSVL
ncbi:hypothetical protein [Roseateles sp.]|uniref:hypothetical protein n=1 Tax=Roseateles sp. TaxID=1971397 RepID=UPI0032656D2D